MPSLQLPVGSLIHVPGILPGLEEHKEASRLKRCLMSVLFG